MLQQSPIIEKVLILFCDYNRGGQEALGESAKNTFRHGINRRYGIGENEGTGNSRKSE